MPSYVRAGIRKCARIRALSKTKELITSFNGVLEKNALGFYPDWPTSTFYDELNSSLQELVNGTSGVKDVLNQMKDNYDKGVEAAGVKS